jgi:hypothetical protein
MAVPGLVSVMVAVQFVAWLTVTDARLHETDVEVVLGVAVWVDSVELVEWIESPP